MIGQGVRFSVMARLATIFFNQSYLITSLRINKYGAVVYWLKASDQEISLLLNNVVHVDVPMLLTSTLQSLCLF